MAMATTTRRVDTTRRVATRMRPDTHGLRCGRGFEDIYDQPGSRSQIGIIRPSEEREAKTRLRLRKLISTTSQARSCVLGSSLGLADKTFWCISEMRSDDGLNFPFTSVVGSRPGVTSCADLSESWGKRGP